MTPTLFKNRFRDWLSPVVYLSNNWISLVGVVLVTSSAVFWLFLLPASLGYESINPYMGILGFLIVPAVFIGGLLIIPLGIWLRFRQERKRGSYPANFPPLNFRNVELRRLLVFVGVTTAANLVIASQASYTAVNYMDSVEFCGQTCHTVMQPEFAAYQNSPHSRVECVKCHIGPGASWFVRSKLSGVGQVFAVTFNTYDRPIPIPVQNLRPARETCEACHWPERYGGERLRVIPKYGDDEQNSLTKTVLLMHIGGANRGRGIHTAHVGPGVTVRYAPADESRQEIPWVEYTNPGGVTTMFLAEGANPEAVKNLPTRVMDCVDCHNRPTHTFQLPDQGMDEALAVGRISSSLPYVKKIGAELLKKSYGSREEAAAEIPAALEKYYRENYPAIYTQERSEIERSAQGVLAIYQKNVFPAMKVTWGTYPNNIGHTNYPGCFRCHDGVHTSSGGKAITQDCSTCHELLAMEEAAPPILTDLGMQKTPLPTTP
jgi:hypothetical protein